MYEQGINMKYLLFGIFILGVALLIIREIVLWYFKIRDIHNELKQTNAHLKKIFDHLNNEKAKPESQNSSHEAAANDPA